MSKKTRNQTIEVRIEQKQDVLRSLQFSSLTVKQGQLTFVSPLLSELHVVRVALKYSHSPPADPLHVCVAFTGALTQTRDLGRRSGHAAVGSSWFYAWKKSNITASQRGGSQTHSQSWNYWIVYTHISKVSGLQVFCFFTQRLIFIMWKSKMYSKQP